MHFAGRVVEPEETSRDNRNRIFLVVDPGELSYVGIHVVRKRLVTDLCTTRQELVSTDTAVRPLLTRGSP